MTNSENANQNVIRTDRWAHCKPEDSSTTQTVSRESEPPSDSPESQINEYANQMERMMQEHLIHASAEINSAMREGFYVHMMKPDVAAEVEINEAGEVVISNMRFRLNYAFAPMDSKKEIVVDHRDEMARRRNGDYQPPPGGVS